MTVIRFEGGKLIVHGAREADEVHTLERFGTVNVTRIWREIKEHPGWFQATMCVLDESLVDKILSNRDLDMRHLREINIHRDGVKPALILDHEDGEHSVIDGNHTIIALHRAGLKEFPAYMIPRRLHKRYEVSYYLLEAGKKKRKLSGEEVLKHMIGRYTRAGSLPRRFDPPRLRVNT